MADLIELTGLRFGKWTVLEHVKTTYDPMWLCRCDCGTVRPVSGPNLRNFKTLNCGCERRGGLRHGHGSRGHRTPTYRSWKSMRSRCRPNAVDAANYFERGITVCERWDSFEAFLADIGERPEGTTLDRVNNDGHYEPGNCRWASKKTQRTNNRRIVLISIEGENFPLKYAAARIGISDGAVHQERARNGGTFQEAFERVAARRHGGWSP